jgi:hypothetical protein
VAVLRIKASKVDITIHKPIYTRDLTSEEIKDLPEAVFAIIQSKL